MFQHFPHIEGFHNVVKSVAKYPEILPKIDTLTYAAKVKLHGTNAAILVLPAAEPITTKQKNHGGTQILAQSRSRIISSGDDNMGFGKWLEDNKDNWDWPGLESICSLSHTESVLSPEGGLPPVTIFGEWCGQGIMKGVAVSGIDTKVFCIFAIQIGDSKDENAWVITDPEQIKPLVPNHPQIKVIPYLGWTLFIDFTCTESMVNIVNFMNNEVDKVEACDPFIKKEFGVEGLGEGLVFYPIIDEMPFIKRSYFSNLTFKAKGEKHKVTKQRNAVQIDPEVMISISEFVQKTVTEVRLEQGVREVARGELDFDMKLIGPFLAWIGQDIKRETVAELEASDLNWRMVQKNVTAEARNWYIAKCKEL